MRESDREKCRNSIWTWNDQHPADRRLAANTSWHSAPDKRADQHNEAAAEEHDGHGQERDQAQDAAEIILRSGWGWNGTGTDVAWRSIPASDPPQQAVARQEDQDADHEEDESPDRTHLEPLVKDQYRRE